MAHTNNFDMSSTGTNIEFYGYYDKDLAENYWQENYKEIKGTKNTYFFTDYGQLKNQFTNTELTVKSRLGRTGKDFLKDLQEYAENYTYWRSDDQDTIEELIEFIVNNYEINDLIDYRYNNKNFVENLDECLQICFKKDPDYIDIRGYSQGDFARVYFDLDAVRKLWGTPETTSDDELKKGLRKQFEQQFFDSPVFACVTINDTDYNYYDCPDADEYAWKRNEFLQWVTEKSGVEYSLISAIVPKELSYE